MTNYLRISVLAVLVMAGFWPAASLDARITEPVLADYSKTPVFASLKTPPNIMVIFDSSGSMGWNAYGDVKTNGATRTDVYVPLYGKETTLSYAVNSGVGDAEEYWSTGLAYNNGLDLDLGRTGPDRGGRVLHNLVGMRFEDIAVDPSTEIVSAYLEMEAARTAASALVDDLVMVVTAEPSPTSSSFANLSNNISDRDDTQSEKFWTSSAGSWVEGNLYQIPGLIDVVQEVVNHPAWVNGNNAINLKLTYGIHSATAQRNIVSYEGWRHDPTASRPTLYVTYRSETGTRYYGYFNSDWLYTSDTNEFTHKYKKISFLDSSQYDMGIPAQLADWNNLLTNSGCVDGQWWVRYPADYSSPDPVEANWATKCLDDADFSTEELYDGNWMNWATTRRVDVARKIMTGGLGAMYGLGNQTLYGDAPPDNNADWRVSYDSTAGSNHAVTPSLGNVDYDIEIGNKYTEFVDTIDNHIVGVLQNPYFDLDSFTSDGKLGGILQTFWDDAYWGLTTYQTGSTSGGDIQYGTKDHPTNANYMSAINNLDVESWTPLAETLYSVTQYFRDESPANNLGYTNQPINHDPFLRNNKSVACIKNFVLLISDGNSTSDSRIPDWLKGTGTDQDGDGDEYCENNDYGCVDDYDGQAVTYSNGSDYLDDVALYAHTTDLRPEADLEGDQLLDIYTIYAAFGADPNSGDYLAARNLMIDTAINGGFEDQDGDGMPTFTDTNGDGDWDPGEPTSTEFDKDGDNLPDNYFEASDGAELKAKLSAAITSILAKSASGTAVSVLATSSEGEGTLVQAYFKPKTTGDMDGTLEMKWAGFLQTLWVDSYGNMREDTGTPLELDEGNDKIITFLVENGDTKVNKFDVSPGPPDSNEYPSTDLAVNSNYTRSSISTVVPIWEAGRVLAHTTADPNPPVGKPRRNIFTYTDGTDTSYFGGVEFHPDNTIALRPYFGVFDNNTWRYLGSTINDRALNLINYTRGYDTGFSTWTSTRNRTILVDNLYKVWKLGDIVNSTPVTIQQPPDNYDFIYADRDYAAYKQDKIVRWEGGILKGWETMVYVGANDGMLHAFTGWKYDKDNKTFKQPGSTDASGNPISGTFVLGEDIGQELWAYIPRALLPHLKWSPDPDYIHTYYVDLRPKVVDVHGFTPDAEHINGWGTVLIGGLRMGGKEILTEEDFDNDGTETVETFTSSYFAIDITDPRNPNLLWENSYEDLGLTTSEPTIMKVGDLVPSPGVGDDKWFIVFGSGPNDPNDTTSQGAYEGVTSHVGRIYVVDVFTGDPVKGNGGTTDYLFSTDAADGNSFMGGAAGVDKYLNFNVDAVYIGATHDNGSNPDWLGSMYKITVPWRCTVGPPCDMSYYGDTTDGEFVNTPLDGPGPGVGTDPWTFSKLFASPGPITAPPSLSIDPQGNTWVYFGTGRYMSTDDKSTDDQQYLFGVKDPFFNYQANTYTPDCCGSTCASDPNCGRYSADYFMDYTNNLVLDENDLFDGDTYKVFFPWTANPSVAGDPVTCDKSNESALNPLFKIGDILGDDSCIAYNYVCTDTVAGGCATGPITNGDMGPAGDGDIDFDSSGSGDGLCSCRLDDALPKTWGIWGVVPTSGDQADCMGLSAGELGDIYGDATCIGMYWDASGLIDTSCDGVSFGQTVVNGGTDGTCNASSNVSAGPAYTVDPAKTPDLWYYPRPVGDCTGIDPNYVGSIYNDPLLAPFDGYCLSTFWTCKEDGDDPTGECSGIDFGAASPVDVLSLGLGTDNDADPEDDCICSYSQEPVAHVKVGEYGSAIDLDPASDTYLEPLDFFTILDAAREEDGWMRLLATPRERSITKPGLIGGISLFTSYVPNEDVCAFGGDSYLYALYYETGTAYRERVIGWEIDGAGDLVPSDRMRLGTGLASSVGLHIGLQEENTATGFVQQSTGAITKLRIDPAFQVRSGLTSWRDN